MLVATKAKPNRNKESPLNREYYRSFLDVSLSMYPYFDKFLNIFHSTVISYILYMIHMNTHTQNFHA